MWNWTGFDAPRDREVAMARLLACLPRIASAPCQKLKCPSRSTPIARHGELSTPLPLDASPWLWSCRDAQLFEAEREGSLPLHVDAMQGLRKSMLHKGPRSQNGQCRWASVPPKSNTAHTPKARLASGDGQLPLPIDRHRYPSAAILWMPMDVDG